jgi:hypothetical protein
MSSIIIAAILIGSIIMISFILVLINNKDKRKNAYELFHRFESLAKASALNFSSKEILENLAIGFDHDQKKILAISRSQLGTYDSVLLDLDRIKSYSKRKYYTTIDIGTSKKKRVEKRIDRIVLEFVLMDGQQVQIPFFEVLRDHMTRLHELDQKANDWEIIILNFLNTEAKRIA